MKGTNFLATASLACMFMIPAWAHHAAEGIVSDDIWATVDENLAGTPHIDLDFSDVMGSMRVDEASEGGSMFLVSSITVDEEDCQDYLDVILEVLNDETQDWMHHANGNQCGDYSNTFMPVLTPEECVCEDGVCTFSLYEPIGSMGWSDEAEEVYDPPEAPGPGNKGN